MQSTRLTTKGQLVIPKAIREAMRVTAGTDFEVSIENDRIVLAPRQSKRHRLADWPGVGRKLKPLSTEAVSAPVTDYE